MQNKKEYIFRFLLNLPLWGIVIFSAVLLFILLKGSFLFFQETSLFDFFFTKEWQPFTTITQYGHDYEGHFGIAPVLLGSFSVAFFALLYAIPLSIISAFFLNMYCSPKWVAFLKPILELLAGIPTIVYGFFAVLVISPYLQFLGNILGLDVSSENTLSAALVMAIMLIPYMLSTSLDAIESVPQQLRNASFAMGATKWETIYHVLLPIAWPQMMSSILLALSRGLGETMIVVMALGLSAHLTLNPLEPSTTITVQILSILTGDQEFDSPKTLSTFALALVLFIVTFLLNAFAYRTLQKKRRDYAS